MQLSDEEWRSRLTPDQYRLLRKKGTERPGTGSLLYNDEAGVYTCAACGAMVFTSKAKFESTTPGLVGWPSFCDAIKDAVELKLDTSLGMSRTEVVCRNCGSHLGHLFDDSLSPTGQHYCINSGGLSFTQQTDGSTT